MCGVGSKRQQLHEYQSRATCNFRQRTFLASWQNILSRISKPSPMEFTSSLWMDSCGPTAQESLGEHLGLERSEPRKKGSDGL